MMSMFRTKAGWFTKCIASFMVIIFSFSSLSYSASGISLPEIPFLPQAFLELSPEIGAINSVFKPDPVSANTPFVYLIQDAHENIDAQENILKILDQLTRQSNVSQVLFEGGSLDFNSSIYKTGSGPDVNRKVWDALFKAGEISGLERFALDAEKSLKISGIEDEKVYFENLESLKKLFRFSENNKSSIQKIDVELSQIAGRLLTGDLKKLRDTKRRFENRQIDLMRYARDLAVWAHETSGMDFSRPESQENWPQIYRLLKLSGLEKELSLHSAEIEKELVIARSGATKQSRFVWNAREHWRARGRLRWHFEHALDEIRNRGESPEKLKNLKTWIGFHVLQNEISPGPLFDELARLEKTILDQKAPAKEVREFLALEHDFTLLRKLFTFELSREELAEIKTKNIPPALADIQSLYYQAIKTYDLVLERDRILAEKAYSAIQSAKSKNIALVAGGFHSSHLEKFLKEKKLNYAVITPAIRDINHKLKYRERITLAPSNEKVREANQIPPVVVGAVAGGEAYKNYFVQKKQERILQESLASGASLGGEAQAQTLEELTRQIAALQIELHVRNYNHPELEHIRTNFRDTLFVIISQNAGLLKSIRILQDEVKEVLRQGKAVLMVDADQAESMPYLGDFGMMKSEHLRNHRPDKAALGFILKMKPRPDLPRYLSVKKRLEELITALVTISTMDEEKKYLAIAALSILAEKIQFPDWKQIHAQSLGADEDPDENFASEFSPILPSERPRRTVRNLASEIDDLIHQEKWSEALPILSELKRILSLYGFAFPPALYLFYGMTLMGLESWTDAREMFSKAINIWKEINGSSAALEGMAEGYTHRGLIHLEQEDYYNALTDFDAVLKIQPTNAGVMSAMGETHLLLGNYAEARSYLQPLLLPNSDEVKSITPYLFLAYAYRKLKKFGAAKLILKKGMNRFSDPLRTAFYKALVLFEQGKDVEALKKMNRLIHQLSNLKIPELFLLRAHIFWNLDMKKEAVADMRQAIMLNSTDSNFRLALARMLFKTEDVKAAYFYLEEENFLSNKNFNPEDLERIFGDAAFQKKWITYTGLRFLLRYEGKVEEVAGASLGNAKPYEDGFEQRILKQFMELEFFNYVKSEKPLYGKPSFIADISPAFFGEEFKKLLDAARALNVRVQALSNKVDSDVKTQLSKELDQETEQFQKSFNKFLTPQGLYIDFDLAKHNKRLYLQYYLFRIDEVHTYATLDEHKKTTGTAELFATTRISFYQFLDRAAGFYTSRDETSHALRDEIIRNVRGRFVPALIKGLSETSEERAVYRRVADEMNLSTEDIALLEKFSPLDPARKDHPSGRFAGYTQERLATELARNPDWDLFIHGDMFEIPLITDPKLWPVFKGFLTEFDGIPPVEKYEARKLDENFLKYLALIKRIVDRKQKTILLHEFRHSLDPNDQLTRVQQETSAYLAQTAWTEEPFASLVSIGGIILGGEPKETYYETGKIIFIQMIEEIFRVYPGFNFSQQPDVLIQKLKEDQQFLEDSVELMLGWFSTLSREDLQRFARSIWERQFGRPLGNYAEVAVQKSDRIEQYAKDFKNSRGEVVEKLNHLAAAYRETGNVDEKLLSEIPLREYLSADMARSMSTFKEERKEKTEQDRWKLIVNVPWFDYYWFFGVKQREYAKVIIGQALHSISTADSRQAFLIGDSSWNSGENRPPEKYQAGVVIPATQLIRKGYRYPSENYLPNEQELLLSRLFGSGRDQIKNRKDLIRAIQSGEHVNKGIHGVSQETGAPLVIENEHALLVAHAAFAQDLRREMIRTILEETKGDVHAEEIYQKLGRIFFHSTYSLQSAVDWLLQTEMGHEVLKERFGFDPSSVSIDDLLANFDDQDNFQGWPDRQETAGASLGRQGSVKESNLSQFESQYGNSLDSIRTVMQAAGNSVWDILKIYFPGIYDSLLDELIFGNQPAAEKILKSLEGNQTFKEFMSYLTGDESSLVVTGPVEPKSLILQLSGKKTAALVYFDDSAWKQSFDREVAALKNKDEIQRKVYFADLSENGLTPEKFLEHLFKGKRLHFEKGDMTLSRIASNAGIRNARSRTVWMNNPLVIDQVLARLAAGYGLPLSIDESGNIPKDQKEFYDTIRLSLAAWLSMDPDFLVSKGYVRFAHDRYEITDSFIQSFLKDAFIREQAVKLIASMA